MNKTPEEYDFQGLAIGNDVTLVDGRTAQIVDIYDKNDVLLAEVEFSSGFKLTGVPLTNMTRV